MSVILETPDHPRSCGANLSTISTSSLTVGSSPLVRGQPERDGHERLRIRIIPARAGPTDETEETDDRTADHPRSCGANPSVSVVVDRNRGSSPLVRGQLLGCRVLTKTSRIIPARAGPTCRGAESSLSEADHPRSCGANSFFRYRWFLSSGSSPLVRGQQLIV